MPVLLSYIICFIETDDEDNGSAKQSKPDTPSVSYRTKLTSILSEEILKTLPIQVKMELVNEGVGDPESAKSDTGLLIYRAK